MPRTNHRVLRPPVAAPQEFIEEGDEGEGQASNHPAYTPPPPSFMTAAAEGAEGLDDLSILDGTGWVRVSRVGNDGEMMFIKKLERKTLADDITLLGRTWGGGRYWLEIQNASRHWVKRFYVNFDPKEYGPPKGTAVPVRVDGSGQPIIIEQGNQGTDPVVVAQLAALQKSQETKDAEIRALNQQIFAQQSENNRMILEMVTKLASSPKSDPMAEMQRIAAMRDLFGGGAPKSDGLSDLAKSILPELLGAFKDWATHRPAVGPVVIPDNSTPLERMIQPLLTSILPVLARGITQQATAPKPPLRRAPVSGPVNPASATGQPLPVQPLNQTNGAGEGVPLVEKIKAHPMVKYFTTQLLEMIRVGDRADDAAEKVADLVPNAYWDVLVQIVERTDMVAYLSVFEPELANHGPWLTALADALKRDHIESNEEDLAESGAPIEDDEEDDLTSAGVAPAGSAPPASGGDGSE